jgi:hypothetical protein
MIPGAGRRKEPYERLRPISHILAVVALLSLVVGLILHNGSVSFVKTVCFGIVLFGWYVAIPLARMVDEPANELSAVVWEFHQTVIEYVMPYVFLGLFSYMIFTSWKASRPELGISEVIKTMKTQN